MQNIGTSVTSNMSINLDNANLSTGIVLQNYDIGANTIVNKSNSMSDIYNEIANQFSHRKIDNISPDTKNRVVFRDGKIIVELYDNGCLIDSHTVITDIVDVKIYPDRINPRVVEVYFSDGTSEKSTLDSNDEFNLDSGITICIAKKFISKISCSKYSTSILNKIVRHTRQVMESNEKDRQKKLELDRLEKARKAKLIEKKRQRDAEREYINQEAFISLLEKAIVRANETIQEWERIGILNMFRYNIGPGHGRIKIVEHFDSAELVVGCSEQIAEVGTNTGKSVDGIELLFSIVIHDPKTAKVYADYFNRIAKILEDNKDVVK